jgi:trigger factor
MNITKEKVDDLNAIIKVQLDQADYQENVDKIMKNHRKNANIPGFRKGQVPMGMIKKQVGVSVIVEEVNKVLSASLQQFISAEKLNLLGNPLPKLDTQKTIDWANQKDFEFSFEVGMAPEFDVDVVSKLKLDYYKIKVVDKDIDKHISDVAKRYGKMSNPDVAEAEDMIFGKFEELDGTGNVKEGGISHTSVIIVEAVTDKKVQKSLVGAKSDDTFEIDPRIVSANPQDQAAAIGVDPGVLATIISKFKFTVEKINKIIPAEINQELFDKVYGPGVITEEKEFRTKVSDELEKGLSTDADRKLKVDIQDELIKKLKLKLPDTFLKRWIRESNEKPITVEQGEAEYDNYSKGLQWQLIENKLVQSNEIKVTQEEVIEHTKGLLAQQMAGMGLPGATNDEELTETANRVLQNEEEARNLYMMLYDAKLMDHYKSTLKLKEKEVTYEAFVKLAYDKK